MMVLGIQLGVEKGFVWVGWVVGGHIGNLDFQLSFVCGILPQSYVGFLGGICHGIY